jgi:hypothetical protein
MIAATIAAEQALTEHKRQVESTLNTPPPTSKPVKVTTNESSSEKKELVNSDPKNKISLASDIVNFSSETSNGNESRLTAKVKETQDNYLNGGQSKLSRIFSDQKLAATNLVDNIMKIALTTKLMGSSSSRVLPETVDDVTLPHNNILTKIEMKPTPNPMSTSNNITPINNALDKRSSLVNRKCAPLQVLCHVCCAEFGTTSLEIHKKTCLKKQ